MSMHNSGRNDTKNPGGSVGFDRLKAVYTPANIPDSRVSLETTTPEQTLGDYIARKQLAASFDEVKKENKMTFDEWWDKNNAAVKHLHGAKTIAAMAWRGAQENV